MGFRRITALLLSAMLLLMPTLSAAEGLGFSAGDLTVTTLEESYFGGYQIDVAFGFDVDADAAAAVGGEKAQALAKLLSMAQVKMSFYDDFGTARIRGNMLLDGVEIASGDMLIFEDGSAQLVTSLTGNMAFTLPAGTITEYGISLPEKEWETLADLPLYDRMRIAGENVVSTVLNLVLGWVSSTQMKTGELYVFDYETYIDATETRDAVATRMIGTIVGEDLVRFLWNIVSHICDNEWELQQMIADCLAGLGVESYDLRQAFDPLFPDEVLVASVDNVVISEYIKDDGRLCNVHDIQYMLRKIERSLMDAWGYNATKDKSSLIVSYDEMGDMVGMDVELKQFTKKYPYEGTFVYSAKTDDDWQRFHTAHGELQVYGNNRLIGDLSAKQGEDVGGVKESSFVGQLDLVNRTTGEALGFGVNTGLTFALTESGESIEANADLLLNMSGESTAVIDLQFGGLSEVTELGVAMSGALDVNIAGLGATVNVSVDCVDYVDAPFEGGQAVDLTGEISQEQIDAVKSAVKSEAAGLAVKFALKPGVLSNLLKLTKE